MGLKFSIVCGLFQVLLIILFAVLVDYSDHASPPHSRKGSKGAAHNTSETLPVNDVALFYPSKIYVQLVSLKYFDKTIGQLLSRPRASRMRGGGGGIGGTGSGERDS